MRVVFMGTPDFAVGVMEEIYQAGHEIVLAVTQPDRPKGRGNSTVCTPVKEFALQEGMEVFAPQKIRLPENVAYIRAYHPDIIVVAAFGQILSQELLDIPPFGSICVHASLLPKYRGASPIQWAVINGEKESGITIMRMDAGIDTGDIVAQTTVPISEEETGGSLFDKLSTAGAVLCVNTMEAIRTGTAVYTPQDNTQATHTGMIRKELGNINWYSPARSIERLIRGLDPWPSAYTCLGGKILKIWKARVKEEAGSFQSGRTVTAKDCPEHAMWKEKAGGFKPGCICRVNKRELYVQTGEGILSLLEVQLEGKKRMGIEEFLRGNAVKEGIYFSQG